MKDAPTLTAWHQPSELVDETQVTPWAEEGWLSWNGQSPEMAVCGFVQTLVQMMNPKLILETGVGQGYMTRAIAMMLRDDQLLIAYESSDLWREEMWSLPFWTDSQGRAQLSHNPTPLDGDVEIADLCVMDSDWEIRFGEMERWHDLAKTGAVAIIHDTGSQPDTVHALLRERIVELGITGTFLSNPRGCFMAIQRRNDGRREESPSQENED